MAIAFEIPKELEESLKQELGDLSRAAKEAFLVSAYQTGSLSLGELAEALGFGVLQAQEWLSRRSVPLNYSKEDLDLDRQTLERLFPQARA